MHDRFPQVFTARGTPPLPLRTGVAEEIFEIMTLEGVEPRFLRIFLAGWTRRAEYQTALVAGGPRYGLDGQAVGEVTPEEQATAAERLAANPPKPPKQAPPPPTERALKRKQQRRAASKAAKAAKRAEIKAAKATKAKTTDGSVRLPDNRLNQ